MKINLTAANPQEQAILDYLNANASEELVAKITEEKKTLGGCMNYLYAYAKSKLPKDKRTGQQCVYVPPEEVFGMAIHYFENEKEGAVYKSPEELREEEEAKKSAEQREAERLAKMTPEEIEAEKAEKARIEAEQKSRAEEVERKRKEREAKEAKRKAKEEAKKCAAEAQMTLF